MRVLLLVVMLIGCAQAAPGWRQPCSTAQPCPAPYACDQYSQLCGVRCTTIADCRGAQPSRSDGICDGACAWRCDHDEDCPYDLPCVEGWCGGL